MSSGSGHNPLSWYGEAGWRNIQAGQVISNETAEGGEGTQSDMTRARYLRSTLQSAPRHMNLTVLPSSAITEIRSFVKRWQRLFSKMGLGALSDSTTTGSTNL